MMADEENVPSSSGEEYIDLDLEVSDNESIVSSPNASPSYRYKIKKELEVSLKKIIEEEELKEENDDAERTFKVIGQSNDQPKNKRTITASWVSNADKFTLKFADNNNLLSLAGLKPEFLPVLQAFTKVWFPVQKAVLPVLLNDQSLLPPRDIVISAPTGSGKTLCYVLPILNNLRPKIDALAVFALVIAPVTNLAEQIYKEFEKFNVFGAKIVSLTGSSDYMNERSALFPDGATCSHANIVVATPGRLVEHLLDECGSFNLSMLRYLVVDEADRMQDMARMEWLELVEKRANSVASNALLNLASLTNPTKNCWMQRILVSATLSLDVHKLHTWNLRCPQLFQADSNTQRLPDESLPDQQVIILPETLTHKLIQCKQNLKPFHLFCQIQRHHDEWHRIIVFVNGRKTGSRLAILLSKLGERSSPSFSVFEFTSNLFRKRRLKLLKDFHDGKIRVLIASDILSRGMDIDNVDCVVNYDMPINERIFAHRAGRTARAMKNGLLLSLATKEEKMRLQKLLIAQNLWGNVQKLEIDEQELNEKAMKNYQKALNSLKNSMTKSVGKK